MFTDHVAQGEAAGPEVEEAIKKSEQKEVCVTAYIYTNIM